MHFRWKGLHQSVNLSVSIFFDFMFITPWKWEISRIRFSVTLFKYRKHFDFFYTAYLKIVKFLQWKSQNLAFTMSSFFWFISCCNVIFNVNFCATISSYNELLAFFFYNDIYLYSNIRQFVFLPSVVPPMPFLIITAAQPFSCT